MCPKNFLKNIDIIIPAYNARNEIKKTIDSALNQDIPSNYKFRIIVIDDNSSDGTSKYIQSIYKDKISVTFNKVNKGRSTARNIGLRDSSSQYIAFIDADCQWNTKNCLASHLMKLESGIDVSLGSIISNEHDFWGRYQNEVQHEREVQFASGNFAAFTSANLAIKRSVINIIGGFDEGYQHYGFEDRDILLRIIDAGFKIDFTPNAPAIHSPHFTLQNITQKMSEAGQYSSLRFQRTHPEYYAQSYYGKIDSRLHGFYLKAIAKAFAPFIPWFVQIGDYFLSTKAIPFYIKKKYLRLIMGLAFCIGTSKSPT